MSYIEIDRTTRRARARRNSSLPHRTADFLRAAWRAYWAKRARRATVLILRSLDDRTLHDIGISSSEIESCVGEIASDHRRPYDEQWRAHPKPLAAGAASRHDS